MDYLLKVIESAIRGNQPPTAPEWIEWIHIKSGFSHCDICLVLDECWFAKNNYPLFPQHRSCHCKIKDILYNDVLTKSAAVCLYSKIDPYLFDPDHRYKHGKSNMLESWGYSVQDSTYLKEEIERQGLKKYMNGDYNLGVLNEYGQRINIRVEIPNRKNGGTVSFITGWMVRPKGLITLNTPYGGK